MTVPERPDPRAVIAAALQRGDVAWEYDEDIDEMEFVLPGSAGREGTAVLIGGEFYVRLDVETGAPLSIIVPAFHSWIESHDAERIQPTPPVGPRQPRPSPRVGQSNEWSQAITETAYRAVHTAMRYRNDLAAAGVR